MNPALREGVLIHPFGNLNAEEEVLQFEIVQQVSLNGNPSNPNEDRIGATCKKAWVIDGATDLGEPGLLGERGGAVWLASETHSILSVDTGSDVEATCLTLFDGLQSRFQSQKTRQEIAGWELPHAAFFLAQIVGDNLEFAWAADCNAIICSGSIARWCVPLATNSVEQNEARALGVGVGAAVKRSQDVLNDRRAKRMQAGYKALSPKKDESMRSTSFGSFPIKSGDDVLLMSDGFTSAVEKYRIYSEEDFWESVTEKGLAAVAQEIRVFEGVDRGCIQFPRFKVSDDASALWLRVI